MPRNDSLEHVNGLLREQLDAASAANQSLVTELNSVKRDYAEQKVEWSLEQQVRCIVHWVGA